jgi:hypothetical protein
MKRRITLSIAVGLIAVLVSMTSSDSTVKAVPPQRFSADTGLIIPGPNQIVRVSMVSVDGELGGGLYGEVRSRSMNYAPDECNGGVCKFVVASQNVSAPMRLEPGEALSFNVGPDVQGNGVRAVVLSNSRKVRVNVSIIDTLTGRLLIHEPLETEPVSF